MNRTLPFIIYSGSIFTLGMYVSMASRGIHVPVYKWAIGIALGIIFLVEIYHNKKQQQQ